MADPMLTEEEKEALKQKVAPQTPSASLEGMGAIRALDQRLRTKQPVGLGQWRPGPFEQMFSGTGLKPQEGEEVVAASPQPPPSGTEVEAPPTQKEEAGQTQPEEKKLTPWQTAVVGLVNKVVTADVLSKASGGAPIPIGVSIPQDDPNIVPFASLPISVRNTIMKFYPEGSRPLYFDTRSLEENERLALTVLMQHRKKELAQRQETAVEEQQTLTAEREAKLRKMWEEQQGGL